MPAAPRLVSLDVFRGLTMATMVVVNNPGDWGNVYWPLLHAAWHGWTPTDLVFPFFLFIVGVSITLSQKSASWGSILRRAALIFALGLFLAGYPRFDLGRWRIPGVLQRIALCYLVAAAAYRLTAGNRSHGTPLRGSRPSTQAWVIGAFAVILALGYWAVMMFVPPPGGVAGDLTPEGNLGAWIDRALMSGHLWKPRWDPEGLLSTIPAIATTLLGVLAGMCLSSERTPERKTVLLALGGAAAMVTGLAWGFVFPINKALWTSSYAVFTAGFAALLLALCYWAIDIRGWKGWTRPLVVLGSNAITLFMASGLLVKTLALIRVAGPGGTDMSVSRWAYLHAFAPSASPKNASLLYALANLVLLYALLAWMYRRRLFLRV
ncbi:MAG TPA: heparan-alpha-glucosaminide N-acetyltransferase domain-containing protein [Vicinamibacterales bacterium]|nr:heparan-alpha-glucosaminide N-acetyltransferase domain-containing protein [Vicinamibacterales bacterium]